MERSEEMDFAARRYALEAQRRGLTAKLPKARQARVGAKPLSWQPTRTEQAGGDLLECYERDELHRIDVALARLREGSYGFCQICGDDIDEARLDANPATPFCGKCDH